MSDWSDDDSSSNEETFTAPTATDTPRAATPEVAAAAVTAEVPEPVAAAPPAPVMAQDVSEDVSNDVDGDQDDAMTTETKADPTPAAPAVTKPAASVVAPAAGSTGSGGARGPGASACPVVCSPGVEILLRWMTWKEIAPGAIIVSSAITLYALSLQGVAPLSVFALVALFGMLCGAVVKGHNHFMEPEIAALRVPITSDACASLGRHIGLAVGGVFGTANEAMAWSNPCKSLRFMAYLWLVYTFAGVLSSPGFLCAVVLVAFSAPMVFDMLRPQLTGVYAASVKPIMSVVVAKIHTAHAFLNGLDNKRQAVLAAGVAVVILIVWQLFGSYISLCSILSFFATSASLATVVAEQLTCASCCPGAKKKTN